MSRSSQFSQPQTPWGWKWRIWWGRWRMDSPGARLAKLASGVVILGFSIGATLFFRYIFSSILKLEGIGEPLLWRTLSLAWGAVFVLLIISNLITGIATLYRSPELAFLFSRPISYRQLFLSRWVDNLAYSSWSLMVLGFPLLVAWGWALKVKAWWIIGAIFAGLVPLIVIAAVVGSLLLMILVVIARKLAPWVSVLLIVLTLSGGIGYLTYV
ncbi:MAG: putative ABC transporter permease subunit, partial [bacterium]